MNTGISIFPTAAWQNSLFMKACFALMHRGSNVATTSINTKQNRGRAPGIGALPLYAKKLRFFPAQFTQKHNLSFCRTNVAHAQNMEDHFLYKTWEIIILSVKEVGRASNLARCTASRCMGALRSSSQCPSVRRTLGFIFRVGHWIQKRAPHKGVLFFGASDLTRTGDLLITSEMHYRLCYTSNCTTPQYYTEILDWCQLFFCWKYNYKKA